MRAILDSGPLIALWRKVDRHKAWVEALFKRYTGPFYVTEPVLTEIAYMTGRDREVLQGLRTGRLILAINLKDDLEALDRCLAAYEHCDLADASVIVTSEKRPTLDVLSTDRRHFTTYRRADRTALPLVLPPAD